MSEKNSISKDTICIILTILFVGVCLALLYSYQRKQEMFELIHVLSNGDIMWYPRTSNDKANLKPTDFYDAFQANIGPWSNPDPAMGNTQPYLVKCSEDKNQQLCQYLKSNQAPAPQFADTRTYSDYAYGRSQGKGPFRPFNATWG